MAHFTTSDGVRIYYESHGTGDPLLLAYGIGGNAGMWQPNMHGPLGAAPADPLGAAGPRPLGEPRRSRPRSPSATGCSTCAT